MNDLRHCGQTVFPSGSIWITDIPGAVREKSSLRPGARPSPDAWQCFDYETMSGIRGQLIYLPEINEAGELTIPLPAVGWYRIFLGLVSLRPGMLGMGMGLKAKLDCDPAFYAVSGTGINFYWEMTDNLWRMARLDNNTLHLRPSAAQSSLAWIRLEPMTDTEITALARRRDKLNKHELLVTNDGYGICSLEDFYGAILPLRDSNAKKLYFCLAQGDVCDLLPTRCGTVIQPSSAYPRPIDRSISFALAETRRRHPDIVAKLCDFSHQCGVEFHASCRPGAVHMPGFGRTSEFFRAHPEFHCVNRDGIPATRLSFAVPEVQDHFLELFREMLEYEIDGLNLIFIRALPGVLYETAFRRSFSEVHGVDPLELPEGDPRIAGHRAVIMGGFIRRVRTLLDEYGVRRKKYLELSLTVPANREVNTFHGMALKEWVDAGLVDVLMVDSAVLTRFHDERQSNIEYPYFVEVCSGNRCRFYPKLFFPSDGTGIRDAFREVIARGASGGMLWDGGVHNVSPLNCWEYAQMLGDDDPAALDELLVRHPAENRLHLLKTVEGFDCDLYPPHNSF